MDWEASGCPIELESATVDTNAPLLLPPAPKFPSRALGEKYPAHNRGVVPATVALTFDALERFLLPNRPDIVEEDWRYNKQTVLRPLDRKALARGDRIIISCLVASTRYRIMFLKFPSMSNTD